MKQSVRPARTPLTFMEELHLHFEARLIANGGKALPLSQSVSPSPELLDQVRQRYQEAQDAPERRTRKGKR
jgi:hypothetical protein